MVAGPKVNVGQGVHMNTLDIVFCVILGFLGIRGVFRGLIKEIASILGLILGFVLANTYHAQLTPFLEPTLGSSGAAGLASYLGIFLGVVAAVFLLATLIRKILKLIMLGWLDSLGGGALGFFKGLLLCSVVVLALTAFLPPKAEILATSQTVPYINTFNTLLAEALPQNLREQFLQRSRQLQQEFDARVLNKFKKIQEPTNGQ